MNKKSKKSSGIVSLSLILCSLCLSFCDAAEQELAQKTKCENATQAFGIVRHELKEQQKTISLMRSGLTAYTPLSLKQSPLFGDFVKSYIPSFFSKRERQDYGRDAYIPREIYHQVLQITKGYKWLCLHSDARSEKYTFMIVQQQKMYSLKAYLKSKNHSTRFYSREEWGKEMSQRFDALKNAEEEEEKILCVREMKKIADPQWYLEVHSRELTPEVCRKIDKIMTRFQNRQVETSSDTIDMARLHDSDDFKSSFMLDGTLEYTFYGCDSEIFGVSLPEDILHMYQFDCRWYSQAFFIFNFWESLARSSLDKNIEEKELDDSCEYMLSMQSNKDPGFISRKRAAPQKVEQPGYKK